MISLPYLRVARIDVASDQASSASVVPKHGRLSRLSKTVHACKREKGKGEREKGQGKRDKGKG